MNPEFKQSIPGDKIEQPKLIENSRELFERLKDISNQFFMLTLNVNKKLPIEKIIENREEQMKTSPFLKLDDYLKTFNEERSVVIKNDPKYEKFVDIHDNLIDRAKVFKTIEELDQILDESNVFLKAIIENEKEFFNLLHDAENQLEAVVHIVNGVASDDDKLSSLKEMQFSNLDEYLKKVWNKEIPESMKKDPEYIEFSSKYNLTIYLLKELQENENATKEQFLHTYEDYENWKSKQPVSSIDEIDHSKVLQIEQVEDMEQFKYEVKDALEQFNMIFDFNNKFKNPKLTIGMNKSTFAPGYISFEEYLASHKVVVPQKFKEENTLVGDTINRYNTLIKMLKSLSTEEQLQDILAEINVFKSDFK